MCERELETEQNCNILTPTLLAITAFLSRSLGLLNRESGGLGAQPLWDMFLNPASSLQLQLLNRGPEGPLCWVLAFSTASCLQLIDFLSSPGLYNNLTSTLLPVSVTISHSFNLSTVKVIISWYSSTGCTYYLHRCISYFDSPAGSEVSIQHRPPGPLANTLPTLNIAWFTYFIISGTRHLNRDVMVIEVNRPKRIG